MTLGNLPTVFYDHSMLDGPRRGEQIEHMISTARDIARAGIPIVGQNRTARQYAAGCERGAAAA